MKYDLKAFRLNKNTINNLAKIKKESKKSYNLVFWDLIKLYNQSMKNNEKVNFNVNEGDTCPHCKIGVIIKKHSKYGEFLACDQFPNCAFKQNIKEKLDIGMAGFKD